MIIGSYYITVAIITGIYVILALSLNIITGMAGQPSLGHAAFFGIGAYTSAILTTRYGLPFGVGLAAAMAAAGLFGAILGMISVRVRDDFLAITTIGINFVVVAVFLYFPFFGESYGVGGIPLPSLGGWEFNKPAYLAMVLVGVGVTLFVSRWVQQSWFGLGLAALREDDEAAEASGIDTKLFKVAAFSIGTALAGGAGSLYAHFMMFISSNDFGFPVSITILSMVVVGGLATLRGPILGAVLLSLAPEVFRPIMEYRTLLYGVLLVVMMRFLPAGLLGDEGPVMRWVRARGSNRRREAAVDGRSG